jgi:hypothetical protein
MSDVEDDDDSDNDRNTVYQLNSFKATDDVETMSQSGWKEFTLATMPCPFIMDVFCIQDLEVVDEESELKRHRVKIQFFYFDIYNEKKVGILPFKLTETCMKDWTPPSLLVYINHKRSRNDDADDDDGKDMITFYSFIKLDLEKCGDKDKKVQDLRKMSAYTIVRLALYTNYFFDKDIIY